MAINSFKLFLFDKFKKSSSYICENPEKKNNPNFKSDNLTTFDKLLDEPY